jgi:hypothetical protein
MLIDRTGKLMDVLALRGHGDGHGRYPTKQWPTKK